MKPGTPKRKFRPISLEHMAFADAESTDESRLEAPMLAKPIPRSSDGLVFLSGQLSGNTLTSIEGDPPDASSGKGLPQPKDDQVPISTCSSSKKSDFLGSTCDGASLGRLTLPDAHAQDIMCPANVKIPSGEWDEGSPGESDRGTLVGRKISRSVSFADQVLVETIPSLTGFKKGLRSGSACSEESAPASSFAQCPTITSIQTNNSSTDSLHGLAPRPPPLKERQSQELGSHGLTPNAGRGERKRSLTPNPIQKGKVSISNTPRGPTMTRKSAPLMRGSFREDETAHFKDVIMSHRGMSEEEQVSGRKPKMFSSSSSSAASGDGSGNVNRKPSKGRGPGTSGRLSLKLFDKTSSRSSDDDESNPWFQAGSVASEDPPMSDEDKGSGSQHGKLRKKGLKKLGLNVKFRKDGKERDILKMMKRVGSESSEPDSVDRTSSVDDSSSAADKDHRMSVEYHRREQELRHSLTAKASLKDILEKLMRLPDRPRDELSIMLAKFLATSSTLEQGVRTILFDAVPSESEAPLSVFLHQPAPHLPYRELLLHSYINGSVRIKKAIVNNKKVMLEMLTFLSKEEGQAEKLCRPSHIHKVNCVVKILNCLLSENASELTEHISAKKGFLEALIRNYIHVAEVVDFLSQLCTANALSDSTTDENRYGAPNASGILLLGKEAVYDLLKRIFVESSRMDSSGQSGKLRLQTQEMSMRCLLELSKRCVAIPPFSKSNCSYGSKFIKSVNGALRSINSFENTGHVKTMLEAGLSAIERETADVPHETAAEMNNAAVCALLFVVELLEMVQVAVKSKSIVTRRTIGEVQTQSLEELMLSQVERLTALLLRRCKHSRVVRGRLKIAIVKTFCRLFGSRLEATARVMGRSGLPDVLLHVLRENKRCSILQRDVVECVVVSMESESTSGLQKAWFEAMQISGGLMDELGVLLAGEGAEGDDRYEGEDLKSYRSSLMDIGLIASRYSENVRRGEFRELFKTEKQYNKFTTVIEPGLRRVEEQRSRCCGGPKPEAQVVSVLANAESLAARLDDVNAV